MKKEIHQVDGKFYEKCKVVMLPTKEKAIPRDLILSCTGKLRLLDVDKTGNFIKQHLYILSNEEIKEGDYYINTYGDTKPLLCKCDDIQESRDCNRLSHWCKKIIATTDESLQICVGKQVMNSILEYSSLPRPSNEFLKKFCELNGIWEVLVKYEQTHWKGTKLSYEDKFRLKVAPDNTITIKPIQERTYTMDEVKDLIKKYSRDIHGIYHSPDMNDWIKENL